MTVYSKPYLKPAEQVELLLSRKMEITDIDKAERCLKRIGYYRLSAYWFPFRNTPNEDNFKPNTHFSDCLDLYVFDKKLRLLCLDALERIEVALRTDIALLLGQYNREAHRDTALLNYKFTHDLVRNTHKTGHEIWLQKLDGSFQFSRDDFVLHFRRQYAGCHLPIWMAVELWDFGMLSHFFAGMRGADKNKIASKYGVPSGVMLESWLRTLNVVRNICAHHGRLWNRPLVNQPRLPRLTEVQSFDHLIDDTHARRRFYAVVVIIKFLLAEINPSSSWGARLQNHIEDLPQNANISARHAGFPDNWKEQGL